MVGTRTPRFSETASARSSASPLFPPAVGPQTTKARHPASPRRGSRSGASATGPRVLDRPCLAGRAAYRFADRRTGVEDVRTRGLDVDRHVLPGLGRRLQVHGVAAPGLADGLPVLVRPVPDVDLLRRPDLAAVPPPGGSPPPPPDPPGPPLRAL